MKYRLEVGILYDISAWGRDFKFTLDIPPYGDDVVTLLYFSTCAADARML